MKKSLLALAVLGAFAGAASAQSSVTVYGIADVGVSDTDNGAARTVGLSSGQLTTSRIGFKGTEDLGGGMSALFQLEAGLNIDTGSINTTSVQPGAAGAVPTTGTMFNRVSTVGLQGGFGLVNMGRQTTVFKDAGDQIDPFGQTGTVGSLERIFYWTGAAANSITNVNGTPDGGRASNQIKYTSPTFGGFSAKASYVFGETPGSTSANGQTGLGLAYLNGPLNVQFGFNSAAATTAGTFVNTQKTQNYFLGATYDFGVAKLAAAYANNKQDNNAGVDPISSDGMIGVTVPFGASAFIASVARNNINHVVGSAASAGATQYALGYTYDLSKRTTMYAEFSRLNNSNNLNLGNAGGLGEDVTMSAVGIRHKF